MTGFCGHVRIGTLRYDCGPLPGPPHASRVAADVSEEASHGHARAARARRSRRNGDAGHVARPDRGAARAAKPRCTRLRRADRAPRHVVPVDHRPPTDARSGRRRGGALVRGRRRLAAATGRADRRNRAHRGAAHASLDGPHARGPVDHLGRGHDPDDRCSRARAERLASPPVPGGDSWRGDRLGMDRAAGDHLRGRHRLGGNGRRGCGPRPRPPAPARGDPACPRRRHDRRGAPHHAAALGLGSMDRGLARHRLGGARGLRDIRAGDLLRSGDRGARLPHRGAGRAGNHRLRRCAPGPRWRRPGGAGHPAADRHRSGAGGDGGRLRAGRRPRPALAGHR